MTSKKFQPKFKVGDMVVITEEMYSRRVGKIMDICDDGYYLVSTSPHIVYGSVLKLHESPLCLTDIPDECIGEYTDESILQVRELFGQAFEYYRRPKLKEQSSMISECIKNNLEENGITVIEVPSLLDMEEINNEV